jgi:hypothetical protein
LNCIRGIDVSELENSTKPLAVEKVEIGVPELAEKNTDI